MLDRFPGAQRPAEGELGGRRLLRTGVRAHAISPAFLPAGGPVPVRFLRRLLFLLLFLLLLRVGVRFPLPVLSQLQGVFKRKTERVVGEKKEPSDTLEE